MNFKLIHIIAAVNILLTILFLNIQPAVYAESNKKLVIASYIDDLLTLEPAAIYEFTGAEYAANTYDRLIGYDIHDFTKIHGIVAERWDISEDKMTYVFNIRKNIKFASGNRLTAHDVAFSLQRVVLLDKPPAYILTQFGFTKENVRRRIKAVDDYLVKVRINKPYAPTFFLYCLTSTLGSVVDKKKVLAHERMGDLGSNWLRTNHGGSGPFYLKEWIPLKHIIYERNDNYWGEKAHFKEVHVIHMAGSTLQRQALLKGTIDIARDLEADDIKIIAGKSQYNVIKKTKGSIYYLGLNQKHPYLKIPQVRQAIKYLVDYQKIANTIMNGRAQIHQSFIPTTIFGTLKETPFKFDLKRAKLLLSEVGLDQGFNVTLDTKKSEPNLSLAKSIAKSLAKANIHVTINHGIGTDALIRYRNREHSIYLGMWGTDYMDPHSNASTFAINTNNAENSNAKTLAWRNAWDIPAMSAMTDAALLVTESVTRERMYQEIQQIHQLNSPFVIMFQKQENLAKRSDIKNVRLGPNFDTYWYKNIIKVEK